MSDKRTDLGDRMPPWSESAEQGVLGCLLLDPVTTMPIVLDKLNRKIEPFFDGRHQNIFSVLADLYDKTTPIDLITVRQGLSDRKLLESVGGMGYVAGLSNLTPSAAMIETYIEIVNDKAYQRQAINICTAMVSRIYSGQISGEELTDELESQVMELSRKPDVRVTRRESLIRVVEMLEDMHTGKEIPGLLNTGFPDLDRSLGGLYPGDHIVFAARPGLGKSTLAMNISEYNAIECKKPVGYFSLEMSQDKLNFRSVASRSGIDLSVFKNKDTNVEYAERRVRNIMPTLLNAKIEIEFSPGISIMQLRAKARQMATQHGIKLLIVDMLQLVSGRSEKRVQEIGEVSRGLKALAGELSIPIISISSMNRDIEKADNRRPRLSDLRESGDIESDADVVVFLWQKDPTSEKNGNIQTEVYIAKNRNGNTNEVALLFRKPMSRFESISSVSDVPAGATTETPAHWQEK